MTAYEAMHAERQRAHAKHEPSGHSMEDATWYNPLWLPILTEEVGEVARELCDAHKHTVPELRQRMRAELVQVGAMTAAWIDAIDRANVAWDGRQSGTCEDLRDLAHGHSDEDEQGWLAEAND